MALESIIQRETPKRMKETRDSYETTVALYDIHAPYISNAASSIAKQYIADVQPRRLLIGGDLIDNPGMSLFPKDADHKMDTREEIDYAVKYLAELLKDSPGTEVVFIDGNHDTLRFERLKGDNSSALKNLRGMDFFSQLKASVTDQGYDFPLVHAGKKFELGPGMVFVHGDGRMTPEILGGVNGAKRTADSSAFPGKHIVYGHEHTAGQAASKWGDRNVYKVAAMMDLDTKNYTHMSQYQNGFLVVHYCPNVRPKPVYHVQNVLMAPNKTAIVDGKEYRA